MSLLFYSHIFEAAEPYELLASLVDVIQGGRFRIQQCHARLSPTKKIAALKKKAVAAGLPDLTFPFDQGWDREFRNAIVDSDYVLHGDEVRILHPVRKYTNHDVHALINRALAYHDALAALYRAAIASYQEPKRILVHPGMSNRGRRDEYAVVIVRQGHGAIGMKEGWAPEEISEEEDRITWRVGRFLSEELRMLDSDPTLALLPPTRQDPSRTGGGSSEVM